LFFELFTALLTAAFSPLSVFSAAANLPTNERHFVDNGVPGSGPTSSRLSGRSAQIVESHQESSPSNVDRCRRGDRAMARRAVRGFRDVDIVFNGKIFARRREPEPGVLRTS
jgi:hypothetical protein